MWSTEFVSKLSGLSWKAVLLLLFGSDWECLLCLDILLREDILHGFLCKYTDVNFLVSEYLAAVVPKNLGKDPTIL